MTESIALFLSKAAIDGLKEGIYELTPGGIRDVHTKKIVELFKPLLTDKDKVLTISPCPVQPISDIYHFAVTVANSKKLTLVLLQLKELQDLMWTTAALSAANLVLSAAGFAAVCTELRKISSQMESLAQDLKNEMRKIQMEDKTAEIQQLIGNLNSVLNWLELRGLQQFDVLQIEQYFNQAREMIHWLVKRFEVCDGELGNTIFSLLYDLSVILAAALKEYGADYYYLFGRYPQNYDHWMEALDFTEEENVKQKLKSIIWAGNALAETSALANAFDFTLNTIDLQTQNLRDYREMVPLMPAEAHHDFGKYVMERIEKGEVQIIDDAYSLPEDEKECILLRKNGYAAV